MMLIGKTNAGNGHDDHLGSVRQGAPALGEARQFVLGLGGGVIDVDVMVGGEGGIEGDAEKAHVRPARIDRYLARGGGRLGGGIEDLDVAAYPLDDEDAVVGGDGHFHGVGESGTDEGDLLEFAIGHGQARIRRLGAREGG
jgi:hypothetical protein